MCGLAAALCLGLYALRESGAATANAAGGPKGPATARMHKLKELPEWRPGPGWTSSAPSRARAGEPLRIPIYPPWTREQVEQIFRLGSAEIFDPLCATLYAPSQTIRFKFDEYPGGELAMVVNARSMREDDEPSARKPVLRVLVTGDSHTDGVCANHESFSNLLEAALRRRARTQADAAGQRFDDASIEVLNAGKGGHTFYNYLGTLQRHLDLAPDTFVVTVYGGNDFFEALPVWHFLNNEGRLPRGDARYTQQVEDAVAIEPPCASQGLSSVKYFATFPAQCEVAVRAGHEVLERTQALCDERGIRFVVAYLPPRQDVERGSRNPKLEPVLQALELAPSALASTSAMADDLLARLRSDGIEVVDLRAGLAAMRRSPYWNSDWHLNLAGHRLVSQALLEALTRGN